MKKGNEGIVIVSNSSEKELDEDASGNASDEFEIVEESVSQSVEDKQSDEELSLETEVSEESLELLDSEPKSISNTNIFRTIFSRKTLYHVLVLFTLLTIFGFLSYFDKYSESVTKVIIVFGYGFSFGYFLTAVLSRFEKIHNLSSSEKLTSLIIPLIFSSLFSISIFISLNHSTYGKFFETSLKFGLIIIFILWQFAQAWWMRIPFKEIAIRRMNSYSSDGKSNIGKFGNIFAPVLWSLIGLSFFYFVSTYVPSFSEYFNPIFVISWFLFMISMGAISFYFLRKMHKELWTNPKVASFSAFFAIGYWGFLSYHAGILLYSLFKEPSFVYDLFFMIFTIMLIIYSLSVQTFRAESRKVQLPNGVASFNKSSGFMNKHNVIFYSISFTIVYGASSFFLATDSSFMGDVKNVSRLSHLIVIVSGIIVLLLVNYNLLIGRGLMSKGFFESMRTPKDN